MNVTDVSYGPTGRNIGAELRSEPPLMSVPNPKRSVPVNFLDLVEEDSGSLFVEESYVLGSSRSIRSPIMELNPSRDAAKPAPNASSSRTPEIFDTLGKGPVPSLPLEQRPVSRGVIGSARKVRSSASVQEDHFNSTVSAGNDEDLRRLHDDKHLQVRSTVMPLSVAIRSDWESGAGCLQAPISRPGSTPAHCAQNRPPSHGQENSPTYSCGRDVSIQSLTNSAGDLHLGSGGAGGAVRGRDRDYSFGSLLGLAAQPAGGGSPHRHTANESEIIASTPSAALDGSGLHASRGSSRSLHQQQYSVFADAATPDQWLGGAMSKEQAIRGSLSLGGTVSAPPLLNMYSYGYNSLNNTSAFGAASSASSARFDPLAARYEGVLSEQRREQDVAAAAAAPRGVSALPQRSPAPPTPPLSLHEQPTQQRFSAPSPTQQLQQQRLRVEMVAEGESVEGLVLRSCRDILAGAADHSLKAVELANTLRARVGTEALARIREKWGGLLALLEKHGSSFRVDRIPKNDKVTLLPGQLELTAATSLVGAHRIEAGDGTGEAFLSAAQGSSTSSGALNGNSSNSSSATRCLHVGNVPANMTESQLVREFEKFGQLEGLKLVSQRNGTRRFAFVTFQAVDQAVAARHALSKVHPWKSAISFAHKDYGGGAGATTSGPVHNHSVAKPTQSGGHVSVRPTGHSNSNSRAYAGMSEYQASLLYQMQQHSSLNQEGDGTPIMLPHSGGIPFSYGMMPYGASAPLYWMRTPHAQQPVAPFTMQAPFEPQPLVGGHFASGSAAPYAQGKGGVDSSDCPVLQRLCDDTYVPTQPWPSDPTRDQPYCAAVVAQLQQFGGSTTVSKLRGFLRNRISAVDNIKSVPLKAMLVAYPQHFVLDGNYVHLAGGGGGAHTGHHTHALYNTHAV